MPADTKVVQSLINRAADAIEKIREQTAIISSVLAAYDQISPSIVGTPLEGKAAQLRAELDSLIALGSNPLLDAVVAAKVPTHRNIL